MHHIPPSYELLLQLAVFCRLVTTILSRIQVFSPRPAHLQVIDLSMDTSLLPALAIPGGIIRLALPTNQRAGIGYQDGCPTVMNYASGAYESLKMGRKMHKGLGEVFLWFEAMG